MSCVCIIPARGGSRRIPRKNIKLFHGKPIIAYSIETAQKSGLFDRIIVSTDDLEIAEVAKQYGAEVMMRSEEMSQDEVGTQQVIGYVLNQIGIFKHACCLYPCAPLLDYRTLQRAYKSLVTSGSPYVFPVGNWLRDPGQFYFGQSDYFLAELPLNADGTHIIHIDANTDCDINLPEDWEQAEQMYEELYGH